MMEVAALIKADIGIRAISVSLGGWEHHTDEVSRIASVAGDFASTLAAFHADLGVDVSRTLTLAMTEFGRTAAENGSSGPITDMAGSCSPSVVRSLAVRS